MEQIKTFENNEVLRAEDMNHIGSNINDIATFMENVPHTSTEYPSRIKLGEGLEFDNDEYNNQTLFGKYNAPADENHYLLFAIGDGTSTIPTNAFEIVKDYSNNTYDIKIGGTSLMDKLDQIMNKLNEISSAINGVGGSSLETQIEEAIETYENQIKAYQDELISVLQSYEEKLKQLEQTQSDMKASQAQAAEAVGSILDKMQEKELPNKDDEKESESWTG